MAADGVRGDTATLTALIRALGAGGLVDEALAVFRGMARARRRMGSARSFMGRVGCRVHLRAGRGRPD